MWYGRLAWRQQAEDCESWRVLCGYHPAKVTPPCATLVFSRESYADVKRVFSQSERAYYNNFLILPTASHIALQIVLTR